MTLYGQTDTGSVRPDNQDTFRCGALSQEAFYAVVCDGMGGAAGGSVASRMTADLIEERLQTGFREQMPETAVWHLLESAVAAANALVYDEAMADPELRGMGTTAVIAVVQGDAVCIAHVGDSRMYLVGDDIQQLTRDHSIVQEMIEKGQLTPEEAKHHPRKNLITRAIGVDNRVKCDLQTLTLAPSEGLLLCTDGLTNMVDPEVILSLVRTADDPAGVPAALIDAANRAGGTDNITVVWMAPCC